MSGTITHEWNGTVLTITSDSGTSSADLKGTKGDTGARGVRGLAGADGITSVNGKKGDITLTAEDVGAEKAGTAESVRTQIEAWVEDGYLPLTGGALTGTLTATALYASDGDVTGAHLITKTNNYPKVSFKNAAGTTLADFYVDTTSGGFADVRLKVFSDASTSKYFTFGKNGYFGMPNGFSAPMGEFKSNAWPQLFFRNKNGNNLAQLVVPTDNGSYSGLAVNIFSDASNHVEYKFNSTGVFQAPSWIQGTALVAKADDYPRLNLKNSSGADLSQLYADTSTGAYSDTVLRVCKDASSASFFIFGKNGTFRTDAGITTIGNYISIKNNSYPQFTFINSSGADIGKVFVSTTNGSYAATKIRAYSSASSYYDFSFYGDGKLSCGSLALASPLTIGSGGTGATTEAGARSNLGVEYAKYSTAEIDTGNKWIDGKTIYRAVVYGTTSLSNSLGEVGTLPSAVETPVNIRAYAKGDDGAWRVIPNAYHGNSTWDAMIYINGNTIVMSFGSSWTKTRDFVVIVEYTK